MNERKAKLLRRALRPLTPAERAVIERDVRARYDRLNHRERGVITRRLRLVIAGKAPVKL